MRYLDDLRSGLAELMGEDERVVVLGEDILDPYGGAFKVTAGLSTRFPDRTITTPISEAGFTGVGLGLALEGHIPIIEIMFGDFVTLTVDAMINYATKFPLMYEGVTVPLILRTPMGGGRGYGPTHSQSLEKLFFGVPGLTVVAPSLFHHPGRMLKAAANRDHPTLFVEHKLLYARQLVEPLEMLGDDDQPTALVQNFSSGEADVTIVGYGGASMWIEEAMRSLAREEINVVSVIPGAISPFDPAPIIAAMKGNGRLVVVEEGIEGFGFSEAVIAMVSSRDPGLFAAPPVSVATKAAAIPAAPGLESDILPSAAKVESAVYEVLQ